VGTVESDLTRIDTNNTTANTITSEHPDTQSPGRAVTSYDDVISGGQLEFHAVSPTQRQSPYVYSVDRTYWGTGARKATRCKAKAVHALGVCLLCL